MRYAKVAGSWRWLAPEEIQIEGDVIRSVMSGEFHAVHQTEIGQQIGRDEDGDEREAMRRVCKCGYDPCMPSAHAGWAPDS